MVSLLFIALFGTLWGSITNRILRKKGYRENWFWRGFFFGLIAVIAAMCKPVCVKEPAGRLWISPTGQETKAPENGATNPWCQPAELKEKTPEETTGRLWISPAGQEAKVPENGPSSPWRQPAELEDATGKMWRQPVDLETTIVAEAPKPHLVPAATDEPTRRSERRLAAYSGSEPYAFVSYAHLDSEIVRPTIAALQRAGVRIWFDEGIEVGSDWPEYIAEHLKNSSCVITFISENFVKSRNCRRELTYAQTLEKPMLNAFIGQAKLSAGLEMQLGLEQAVSRMDYDTLEEFCVAMMQVGMIKKCQ